jgi:hypothetical protein
LGKVYILRGTIVYECQINILLQGHVLVGVRVVDATLHELSVAAAVHATNVTHELGVRTFTNGANYDGVGGSHVGVA